MEKIKAIKRSVETNLTDVNKECDYHHNFVSADKSKKGKSIKNQQQKNHIKKNQKNKKNKKNKQKTRKNTDFLSLFKQIYKDFLIIGICFVICSVLDIVIFLNNDYYNFLNRPKPISSSIVVFVLLMFLILLNLFFNIITSKHFLKSPDNIAHENKIVDSSKEHQNAENIHVHDISSKSKISKYFHKFFSKKFPLEKYLPFVFVAGILLSFMAKCLWLCAFFSFCIFFDYILCIIKYCKCKYPIKVACSLMLLFSICVLLSFYLLYMLN